MAVGVLGFALTAGVLAGCGKAGSSGTSAAATGVAAGGCAPIAGQQMVVLDDDKHLSNTDDIIPAVNSKAASPQLLAALNKVSATLDTSKLVQLNKATDVDHQTSAAAAAAFAQSNNLTAGIAKGSGGKIIVGAANFSENQTLAELYKIVLNAAGYTATTQTIGNRELYEPALEKNQIQVVPEYAATLTEFLNSKVNGASAAPQASSDLDATVTALKQDGAKLGLTFGDASQATDEDAWAVTKATADKYSLKTLSDFAAKCNGKASVLGGPPECPQRPFCQPGLKSKYGLEFGQFKALDSGGNLTKTALTNGQITLGLVLSSDPALAG
ncbi:glycine betaine ABC transporter substrate-binding protein [Rugosimonospora acidiphila]|uniref:glycine betaine ABC transporter substrate-binding protein n=1 Tax=Rugosimonospora acidiphila TaxID=556531 RepID=UPI0031F1576F